MSRCLFLCILLGLVATSKCSLSILIVQPLMSTSHHFFMMTLAKGLLQKNHRVHIVSTHEVNVDDALKQNLTHTIFEDVMKEVHESGKNNFVEWQNIDTISSWYFLYSWAIDSCERITRTKAAKELLEMIKRNQFDVIVQDVTLDQCLYGLWEVAKGKPPVIGFVPFGAVPWLKDYIGGSNYPNVRSYMFKSLVKLTTIWQKTLNVVYFIIDDIIRHFYFFPTCQHIAEQYVGQTITLLRELEKTISVILINTHYVINDGIPLPPNAIEIGGMHAQMQSPVRINTKYSESIYKFLDEAENGVIVLSLGTNVKWKHIGPDKLNIVISALSKLKQRVLWKIELELSDTMPKNIMTVKWLPQNDVLNHKNVKAIWTHGGLLSMQEAIWKGVPLIGMPFSIDQMYNIEILVSKGAGIYLDFKTLNTQSIVSALEDIVYNKSYMENMKRLSNEFRDRPLPPLDLAIWSIEYTARNPNATLTSIKSQSWIEWNMIDVYAVLLLILVVTLSIVLLALKALCSYFCSVVCKSRKEKRL